MCRILKHLHADCQNLIELFKFFAECWMQLNIHRERLCNINHILSESCDHSNPSKLTHFRRYFHEDSLLSSSKYLLKRVNLLGFQLRLKVSFMLQNFSRCKLADEAFCMLFKHVNCILFMCLLELKMHQIKT